MGHCVCVSDGTELILCEAGGISSATLVSVDLSTAIFSFPV